jgi:DNA topoisomerase-1
MDDKDIPNLVEDDELFLQSIVTEEKFTQPSRRYNQSSLLEKMEKDNIGTKATRADIIKTLYDRDYFSGSNIFATDIAFAVHDIIRQYCPKIISLQLTRRIEENLEMIESNQIDEEIVIQKAVDEMMDSLSAIKKAEQEIGDKIGQAVIRTVHKQHRLSSCPICQKGTLIIIRSKKTHKRFIGCSSYGKGCRASAPLPQQGTITYTGKICSSCGWPIVYVRFNKKSWKFCVNTSCISKRKVKKNAM